MDVAVIGAGSMAKALGTRAVIAGHTVEIAHRDATKAEALTRHLEAESSVADVSATTLGKPLTAEVVLLAVPYEAVPEVLEAYGDELRDRVLVDMSNPVDWDTMEGLTVAPTTSAAEEIAKIAPKGARVVKAFNTTFAKTLVDRKVDGVGVDVFVAADDDEARGAVMDLVRDFGLRPIDVGGLRHARELEAAQLMHIRLQSGLETRYASALKLLP
jgi:NADPH-dependent F420 reductase